jgi:hypothetical protein
LRKLLKLLALLACLAVTPARAALPDPVAFGVAIEAGDIDAARKWLDEGLPPNFLADRIGSGLMIGAWEGNIAMMELFHARGADVHQTNRYGEQALQLAAWKGRLEAVRWLLERGAAVNRPGKEWGPLLYAVFAGHREVARLLLARGADVNAQAPNGSTVLMMAAREGHEDLAEALIEAGADPRPANDWGDTALTWAMRQGNLRIAKRVSSAEEFARAAKAPPEAFGKAQRSEPAPPEIADLLRQLRLAEAMGKPTEEMRRALFNAIAAFKKESTVVNLKSKRPARGKPQALVITARRGGGGGERAELTFGAATTPAQVVQTGGSAAAPDMGSLVEQLNRAKASGKSTAELRQALFDAVAAFKRNDGSSAAVAADR